MNTHTTPTINSFIHTLFKSHIHLQNYTMPITQNPPKMDPKIWSNLPDELLDHILCFLPLKSIFNLRSTCKRFKSLLFNPFFISHFSSSPLSSFILLSHPHFNLHFPLYDTVLNSWRQGSPVSRSSASLLSSSNGLLCFHLPTSFSFLVTNLLSLSSTLIKFPILPFSFDLLTLISSPSGFKIFAYSSKSVFLYDSKAQSWAQFDGFEPIVNDNFHQEGVHRNGFLHFTTSDPFSIVGFDLTRGCWLIRFSHLPTNELAFIRLASGSETGEKMYMIGGVGRNGISTCLKVWELDEQEEESVWIEIETLPDLMYKKLVSVCYHNYEHVYCFWHQGLICICCYNWPEILYYRVSRRTWHWLPKCPSLPDKWSCGFRWFSFVPRLYASS